MTFSPKREASRARQVLQQNYGLPTAVGSVHPPPPHSHPLIFSSCDCKGPERGEAGKSGLVRETQDHVSVFKYF
jgi:hypothetical protein